MYPSVKSDINFGDNQQLLPISHACNAWESANSSVRRAFTVIANRSITSQIAILQYITSLFVYVHENACFCPSEPPKSSRNTLNYLSVSLHDFSKRSCHPLKPLFASTASEAPPLTVFMVSETPQTESGADKRSLLVLEQTQKRKMKDKTRNPFLQIKK